MHRVLLLAVLLVAVSSHAQFTKGSLQATGLTCAMCSNAVNKALEAVPFVESVRSDIKNSAFAIVFKPGAAVNIDELKTAVEDAGFSVGSLALTGNFNALEAKQDDHVRIGDQFFHFLGIQPQTLQGEQTIRIVDKNFVTAKQFKKFSATTKMECIQTGQAADCCSKDGVPANARIYHVTI